MYFIYILYSKISEKYYIGYSSNPFRRLVEHNTNPLKSYTSKYRPWLISAVFKCSEDIGETLQIEKFIKKQKSRRLIIQLCDPYFVPTGFLAQLVRVPHMRD